MLRLEIPSRRLMAWSLAGVSLWMNSGCSVSSSLQHDPDHVYSDSTPPMLEQQPGSRPLPPRAKYPDEKTTAASMMSVPQTDGVARLNGAPTQIEQAGHATFAIESSKSSANSSSEFLFASYSPDGISSPNGPVFTAAEPRLATDETGAPLKKMDTVAASPLADLFPDEYVFDGGDRDMSAALHTNRSGLDSEDTVAAFSDHTGAERVSASNRVAVYAPRFGSVRTVTGLMADTKVDKAAGAKDSLAVGNLKTGKAAQANIHDTSLSGLESRGRVDGMKGSVPPMETRRTEIAGQNRKVDEGHEGRNISGADTFNRNQGIIIAEQMRNAVAWTREQFPVISAVTTNASEITAEFKVQQTIGVKDERETKGNVRIIKLADRDEAQAGDTITFTIHFENTGDFDVYEVSIVDNLTPRLSYISGSAVIDEKHPGEVSVEPNGEGSQILTFKLDNPLKGHTRGSITFEAVVR